MDCPAPPKLEMMCTSWSSGKIGKHDACTTLTGKADKAKKSSTCQAEDSIFQTPNVLRIFRVNSNFDIVSPNFSTSPSFIR